MDAFYEGIAQDEGSWPKILYASDIECFNGDERYSHTSTIIYMYFQSRIITRLNNQLTLNHSSKASTVHQGVHSSMDPIISQPL